MIIHYLEILGGIRKIEEADVSPYGLSQETLCILSVFNNFLLSAEPVI